MTLAQPEFRGGEVRHTGKRILFFTEKHTVLHRKEETLWVSSTQELISKGAWSHQSCSTSEGRVSSTRMLGPVASGQPRWSRGSFSRSQSYLV